MQPGSVTHSPLPAGLEFGFIADFFQTRNPSPLVSPAGLEATLPTKPGGPSLTSEVRPRFPCRRDQSLRGRWAWPLRPHDWAQAAPPWRAWARLVGRGWAVCPSVSTHHRAQSLFPRLKPSQLKSSKPRVVGATPPPAEERDRCSREGGRGRGPAKPAGGPCPALVMHLQPAPLPQPRAHGQPGQGQERTGGGRAGRSSPPSESWWIPAGCCLPTPLQVLLHRGEGMPVHRGCAADQSLPWNLPQNVPGGGHRAPLRHL